MDDEPKPLLTDLPPDVLGKVFDAFGFDDDGEGDKNRARARMSCKWLSNVPLTRIAVNMRRDEAPGTRVWSKMAAALRSCRGGVLDVATNNPAVLLYALVPHPTGGNPVEHHLVSNVHTLRVPAFASCQTLALMRLLPSLRKVKTRGTWSVTSSADVLALMSDPRVTIRGGIRLMVGQDANLDGVDAFLDRVWKDELQRLEVTIFRVPEVRTMERIASLMERVCNPTMHINFVALNYLPSLPFSLSPFLARIAAALGRVQSNGVFIEGREQLAACVSSTTRNIHIFRRHDDGDLFPLLERRMDELWNPGSSPESLRLKIEGAGLCLYEAEAEAPRLQDSHVALARLLRRVTWFDAGNPSKSSPTIDEDDTFPLLEHAAVLDTLLLANVTPSVAHQVFKQGACNAPVLRRVALVLRSSEDDDDDALFELASAMTASLPSLQELRINMWGFQVSTVAIAQRAFSAPAGVNVTVTQSMNKRPVFYEPQF